MNSRGAVTNPLARKLGSLARLSGDDLRVLDELVWVVRQVPARTDLSEEGDKPSNVYLVMEGFACRYDPTRIVKELISRHPDLTVPPAALLEDVIQVALEAAMSIRVRSLLPPDAEAA